MTTSAKLRFRLTGYPDGDANLVLVLDILVGKRVYPAIKAVPGESQKGSE